MKDFYYILGIDESATPLEIKGAYRKLSKKFHPDLNFNDKYFEKHFREIKEAYETLDDPGKRIQYDKKLSHFKSDPSYQHYAEDLKRREEELRRREEKIRFRQAYPHYYKSRKAPGKDTKRPSTPGERSRIRKIDIGFTLVLIIITLIFGNYVMGVVNDAKAVKTRKTTSAVVADVPFLPAHNKKKHKLRQPADYDQANNAANTKKPQVKVIANDYKSAVAETKAEAAKAPDEEPVPVVSGDAEQAPDQTVSTISYKPAPNPKGGILYATNIISNVTGVTNMRRYDKYGSPIIKEIPTNSKVFVIQKGDVFYKVLCDNSTGYVPKWALEEK